MSNCCIKFSSFILFGWPVYGLVRLGTVVILGFWIANIFLADVITENGVVWFPEGGLVRADTIPLDIFMWGRFKVKKGSSVIYL